MIILYAIMKQGIFNVMYYRLSTTTDLVFFFFQDFLVDLGHVITTCQEDEFIVEVLGILGNISLPDLDYNRVLTQLNLLPSLMDKLKVIISCMKTEYS